MRILGVFCRPRHRHSVAAARRSKLALPGLSPLASARLAGQKSLLAEAVAGVAKAAETRTTSVLLPDSTLLRVQQRREAMTPTLMTGIVAVARLVNPVARKAVGAVEAVAAGGLAETPRTSRSRKRPSRPMMAAAPAVQRDA